MNDQVFINIFLSAFGIIAGLMSLGAFILLLKLMWNVFKFFWEELSDR